MQEKFVADQIIKLYSVNGRKMPKKGKTANFYLLLFQHKLGQITSKSCLNVMKYHCEVGKKDLLNLDKF